MKYIFIVVLAFFTAGCSNLHTYDQANENIPSLITSPDILRKGDRVTITTNDNTSYQFEVMEVSATQIIGRSERINVSDIKYLKVKRSNTLKTFALIGGVFVAAVLINAHEKDGSMIFDF